MSEAVPALRAGQKGTPMHTASRAAGAAITASLCLLASGIAQAAEVRVLAVGAYVEAFKQIVPEFERASGHKISVAYAATPVFAKQIEAGDPFDVAILVSGPLNDLAGKGAFAAGARPTVSTVGLGA